MFDKLKDMSALLGQARQLREKFEQLQGELAKKTAEGDAGAGAVRVTANGKLEVVRVRLDRPLLASLAGEGAEADQRMIEDLVAAAVNDALSKAQAIAREEMTRLSGGMDLPGIEKMLGGGEEKPE